MLLFASIVAFEHVQRAGEARNSGTTFTSSRSVQIVAIIKADSLDAVIPTTREQEAIRDNPSENKGREIQTGETYPTLDTFPLSTMIASS